MAEYLPMVKGDIMKLVKLNKIDGSIILESGLHIGAGDNEMHIGGTDKTVIVHPQTREPYIPGSSIKGKVRALLEMRSGLVVHTDGRPLNMNVLEKVEGKDREEAINILRLFGVSGADNDETRLVGPTRASFADCVLSKRSRDLARANNWPLTEVKSETAIDRITGTARRGSLRQTERIVSGLSFDFTISIKEMESDPDLTGLLLQGLKLLELDALGGSGSRGYGRVRFEFQDEKLQSTFNAISPLC